MVRIWNDIVEEGIAFPQEELLDMTSGAVFLKASHTALWRGTMTTEKSVGCIFSIQTMSVGVAISVMPVMLSVRKAEGCMLAKSW